MTVRAVFSHNTQGRGSRLLDGGIAGLRPDSIVDDAETVVALADIGGIIGYLSTRDRRRLGLDI